MLQNILFILLGLTALVFGGDFLVKGAVGIAQRAKISKLVIGLTVVAFGTSAPELLVSLQSASEGFPEIAVGNVMGSNIVNISLVLGLTVIIYPILVSRNTIRIDWPVLMLFTLLLYIFSRDLILESWEGLILFILLLLYILFLVLHSRREMRKRQGNIDETEEFEIKKPIYISLFFFSSGLVGLYFGANWLIEGAKSLAEDLGMSKRIIGITVVAFGTSVPELATSLVAAYKKETDISVGNLIGSNIFNISSVLGITSIIQPIPLEQDVLSWDLLWIIGIALVLLPMMVFTKKIGRISGIILTTAYIFYVSTLF